MLTVLWGERGGAQVEGIKGNCLNGFQKIETVPFEGTD